MNPDITWNMEPWNLERGRDCWIDGLGSITGDLNVSPPGQEEYPGPTQEGSGGGGGSLFQNAIPDVAGVVSLLRFCA